MDLACELLRQLEGKELLLLRRVHVVDLADAVGTAIDRLAHSEGVLHEGKKLFPTLIAYRRACALAQLEARSRMGVEQRR